MSSTTTLKERISHLTSSSKNLHKDLLNLVIEFSSNTNRVDIYNTFYKQLNKAEEKCNNDIYDALADTMDIIWSGKAGEVQIYNNVLTDEDFTAREASKKIFGK